MRTGKTVLFILVLVCTEYQYLEAQSVKDADGNIYITLNIGKQVWMGENLRTTKLNNGKAIPLVTDDNKWRPLKTPAYCWYNNDERNKDPYGALYNGYTVMTGQICPEGWHVPTDGEWAALADFLGNESTAGDKLKESGTAHWKNIFSKATNDYDFTALPAGVRYYSGTFPLFGDSYAVWWSATRYSPTEAGTRGLHDSSSRFWKGYDDLGSGHSIRCIKD